MEHELGDEAVEGGGVVVAGGAEGEEVLEIGVLLEESVLEEVARQAGRGRRERTSAVLGTLSQKTSILMSPREVCKVTDMTVVGGRGTRWLNGQCGGC